MKTDVAATWRKGPLFVFVGCIGVWALINLVHVSVRVYMWWRILPTNIVSTTRPTIVAIIPTFCTPQAYVHALMLSESIHRHASSCQVRVVHVASGDSESCNAMEKVYAARAELRVVHIINTHAQAISHAWSPEDGDWVMILPSHLLLQSSLCDWITPEPKAKLEEWDMPWSEIPRSSICGPTSPCSYMTQQEAILQYSIGFPVALPVKEASIIIPTWAQFSQSKWVDERVAYALAAAHHQVPHHLTSNWLVSHRSMHGLEAWSYVDAPSSSSVVPAVLCDATRLGTWVYDASRIPSAPWTCTTVPPELPPDTLPPWVVRQRVNETLSLRDARRETYLLRACLCGYANALASWQAAHCSSVYQPGPYDVRWRIPAKIKR